MKTFAIIAATASIEPDLGSFLRSLSQQTIAPDHIEVVLLDDGLTNLGRKRLDAWRRRYPEMVRYLEPTTKNYNARRAAAVAESSAEWITFWNRGEPLAKDHFEHFLRFLHTNNNPDVALICFGSDPLQDPTSADSAPELRSRVLPVGQLTVAAPRAADCFFRRDLLLKQRALFDDRVGYELGDTALTAGYLLAYSDRLIGWIPTEGANDEAPSAIGARDSTIWKDKATYGSSLVLSYLRPLEEAERKLGSVPRWLQQAVLLDLARFFATDLMERSPTVIVDESMAAEFHALVRKIMDRIDVGSIASLDQSAVSPEIRHALLSYKQPECHSPIALDAYDSEQHLVRLAYFIHGHRPTELILLDGRQVEPIYAKYRACHFFRRTLLQERILWLAVHNKNDIEVSLDGAVQDLTIGPRVPLGSARSEDAKPTILEQARFLQEPGKGGRQPPPGGLIGLKVRILRWLARLSFVRRKFANAWVFVDREANADDNAEHLYRWIRRHRPEIRIWFILSRSSWDWKRLSREGFRLITPGWVCKLLLLNCEQIVSSHTDYKDGKLSRSFYGDLMNWRFAFLQHGVIKENLSHWLSNQPFDLFVTTSPAEHASIVNDGTPYSFTDREVRRTGLPRHDALLTVASATPPSQIDLLLIMPTWRASLVDQRAQEDGTNDPITRFAGSEYAQQWGAFLRADELRELSLRHRKTIAFMPHPDAVPFIDAFDPPSYVQIVTAKNAVIRQVFGRTSAFITDYTSVAFTMAFLRRIVFYFQFDRSLYYGGGHNWREGYFDYDRDGFGPVATRMDELIAHLRRYFANDERLDPEYLERMQRAIPERDTKSCERTFQSILDVRQPSDRIGRRPVAVSW